MIEKVPPSDDGMKNPEVKLPNEILIADSYYKLWKKWWKYQKEHKELAYMIYSNIYKTLMENPKLKQLPNITESTLRTISTRLGELAQELNKQKDFERRWLKFKD